MEYSKLGSLLTVLAAIYQNQHALAALSSCGGTLRGSTGTFTSPNYPHSPLTRPDAAPAGITDDSDRHITCQWEIIVPVGFTILLNFGVFNMGAGEDECAKGHVELFSGVGPSKLSLDIYCGSDELRKAPIAASNMTVVFKRRSDFSGTGFLVSYIATSPGESVGNFVSCADRGTDHVGSGSFSVICPGGCANVSETVVRGTSTYRDDSHLCKAAVHAGVITDRFGGSLEVKKLPGDYFYWASEANGVTSEAGSFTAMKIQFERPDANCNDKIGFSKSQITASSYWTEDEEDQSQIRWKPENAIFGEQIEAWSPNDPTAKQWLEIDLGESKNLTGIMTHGSSDRFFTTKSYRIAYRLAGNATSEWTFYREEGVSHDKIFPGNKNIFMNMTNNFIRPRIAARFIRIYPTPVSSKKLRYSLQVALFGCDIERPGDLTVPLTMVALSSTGPPPAGVPTSIELPKKTNPPKTESEGGIGENSILIIAIVAALSVTSILLAALVLFLVKKRKKDQPDTPLQIIPDNNNIGFQYKNKKSRKRNRPMVPDHFQNADYKDTLLPALPPGVTSEPVVAMQNGLLPQKGSFHSANEDSFSEEDDHEYHTIDDERVAANIERGSSKASTGSSLGNRSRKSDTMQRMWGIDGGNAPAFQIQGQGINGRPPMSSFLPGPKQNGTFQPPNNLNRNHTFSHEARYSAGEAPFRAANLRRGNSQSPSRMQRHSSSSNNSSHSYPPFQQQHSDPYYSSVPGADGAPMALNHAMYGRESIPEQNEVGVIRRPPSYKVPRPVMDEVPALPIKVKASPDGGDSAIGTFGRTDQHAPRSAYDRLYRNSSSGGSDTPNNFSISTPSHSQYDQLNLNGA